jgi:hypothetical protein
MQMKKMASPTIKFKSEELVIGCVSDIHLNHRKTDTQFIISNLNEYLSNDEYLVKIDLLFLAGDVFDCLLTLAEENSVYIDIWIAGLLSLCEKHNVILRILEGTPSHDRRQSQRFETIFEIQKRRLSSTLDFKYIDELSIEKIDKLGISVLYIPDEWRHTTEETLVDVKKLLLKENLTQVDYCCMHGLFEHQRPQGIKSIPTHNAQEYLSLVKYLIFIGHIHLYSQFERIIAQGSFDRLSHNEEKAKGFVTATIAKDGTYRVEFVENKTAKKYVTINCHLDNTEGNLLLIDKKVKLLPNGSYARIQAKTGNALLTSLDTLRVRWPLLNWSAVAKDKEEKNDLSLISEEVIALPIAITEDNIVELITQRLTKQQTDSSIIQRCLLDLNDIK